MLVDDPPGEGRIRQECLPLVRQIGGEIGDDRIATLGVLEQRPLERNPFDIRNTLQHLDFAERHHGDAGHHPALAVDKQQVQPQNVQQKAERERDAVVREAGQQEPSHHDPVACQRRGKNHVAAADPRVGLDGQTSPKCDDDGDRVADQRVEPRGFQHLAEKQPPDRPGKQRSDQKGAGELEAPAGKNGTAIAPVDRLVLHHEVQRSIAGSIGGGKPTSPRPRTAIRSPPAMPYSAAARTGDGRRAALPIPR